MHHNVSVVRLSLIGLVQGRTNLSQHMEHLATLAIPVRESVEYLVLALHMYQIEYARPWQHSLEYACSYIQLTRTVMRKENPLHYMTA